MAAKTPEGRTYYYHKVSRVVRWTKPDEDLSQKMEQRFNQVSSVAAYVPALALNLLTQWHVSFAAAAPLHQAEAERQERQRQRLATLAAAEDKKRTEQAAITDADVEVAPRVEAWAKAAGVVRKVKKGTKPPNYRLVMRALLVTLHKVGVVCYVVSQALN